MTDLSIEYLRNARKRLRAILDYGDAVVAVALNGRTPAEWFAEQVQAARVAALGGKL